MLEESFGFVGYLKTCCASSDADHSHVSFCMQRLLCDAISIEVLIVPVIFVMSCTFRNWSIQIRACGYGHNPPGGHGKDDHLISRENRMAEE